MPIALDRGMLTGSTWHFQMWVDGCGLTTLTGFRAKTVRVIFSEFSVVIMIHGSDNNCCLNRNTSGRNISGVRFELTVFERDVDGDLEGDLDGDLDG